MSKAIIFISFKLAEGASAQEFLLASKALNDGYMSKQKGYVAWQQLVGGDTWVDLMTWETMEDAQKILQPEGPNPLAEKFYSFLDMASCQVHIYSVERSYE